MKLSARARYAAKALVDLALHYPGRAVSVKDIAENQNISPKYLEQIIRPLKAASLVTAVRGMHGGYTLAKPPASIKLSDVFTALEGSPGLAECVEHPDACPMEEDCPTRDTWVELTRALTNVLEGTTVQDLVDRKKRKQGSRMPMYYI